MKEGAHGFIINGGMMHVLAYFERAAIEETTTTAETAETKTKTKTVSGSCSNDGEEEEAEHNILMMMTVASRRQE